MYCPNHYLKCLNRVGVFYPLLGSNTFMEAIVVEYMFETIRAHEMKLQGVNPGECVGQLAGTPLSIQFFGRLLFK